MNELNRELTSRRKLHTSILNGSIRPTESNKKKIISILNQKHTANLKMIESLLGTGITYGSQLYKLGKILMGSDFKGVYDDKARKPPLKNGECYLVNRKSNEHWISVVKLDGNKYTYDSFNRNGYLGGLNNGDYDLTADQKLYEQNCGQKALSYLLTTLTNQELFNFVK